MAKGAGVTIRLTGQAFVVMKLLHKIKTVEYDGTVTEIELGGCLGYMPVFLTREEADEIT